MRDGSAITLGIDGSNIRAGGGLTHLSQMIAHGDPAAGGIGSVHLWGGSAVLDRIPGQTWLNKHPVAALDRSMPVRAWWRSTRLASCLVATACDVLFAPGGLLPRRLSIPSVTMSQNMLPFEPGEAARFGRGSAMWWKLQLLRLAQANSFRNASGVVFLTNYARNTVTAAVGPIRGATVVIPHGVEDRFRSVPRPIAADRALRLLYVSVVNVYKHQERVVEAVGRLRSLGFPITLELVGIANPTMRKRLDRAIRTADPTGAFIQYSGAVSFEEVHECYRQADVFLFASSCENLPNIVIEAMGAGLPIASSNRGPMPEVLGEAAVYFDPLDTEDIARAVRNLFGDPSLRRRLANRAYERSRRFNWTTCARETFEFLAQRVKAQHG